MYCGSRILPWQKKSIENLARYIIRASFSQERMTYHRETGQVEYRSKDGKETKMLHALEWLAAMCSQVPNKGEKMVRYYGNYSNVERGKRKKADAAPAEKTHRGVLRSHDFDDLRFIRKEANFPTCHRWKGRIQMRYIPG